MNLHGLSVGMIRKGRGEMIQSVWCGTIVIWWLFFSTNLLLFVAVTSYLEYIYIYTYKISLGWMVRHYCETADKMLWNIRISVLASCGTGPGRGLRVGVLFRWQAIGMCPKERLFKGYVQLERDLGEIDRCRKIYRQAIYCTLGMLCYHGWDCCQ